MGPWIPCTPWAPWALWAPWAPMGPHGPPWAPWTPMGPMDAHGPHGLMRVHGPHGHPWAPPWTPMGPMGPGPGPGPLAMGGRPRQNHTLEQERYVPCQIHEKLAPRWSKIAKRQSLKKGSSKQLHFRNLWNETKLFFFSMFEKTKEGQNALRELNLTSLT